ncbi:MoxR-like ATPase [Anaerobacterium chartisolvens]|uniref:MoxR-like ATPase n=1 Tax=Anaerobacterium chartisolvens TaxID=1297424 RepID=A0A369BGZ2_9FIRM|nr:MoxR family ATPase [Anaerobacterium chartisolvens]RCX20820.1 MoxR-like ATPase [Anaerobacterium chartisolvens]
MELEQVRDLSKRIKNNISRVIVGKDNVIELVLVCLFCSGHILLEDVPGVGKTVLAKCLARSIKCSFKRIQFTPDLLPSDLTGVNFFNQKQGEFVFRAGPIFSNIVLADEINRATPRTQSSLLECMEEGQVTVDGDTRALESPFMVIATQNPIETQGTFSLPEAQLDRFYMRLRMGYPSSEEAKAILDRFQLGSPAKDIPPVADIEEIVDAQNSFSGVIVSENVKNYIINIIEMTRNHDKILLGVSPRGSLALMRASQVMAVLKGRDFVTPHDVKEAAVPVLSHRLILKGHAALTARYSAEDAVSDILGSVSVPTEELPVG